MRKRSLSIREAPKQLIGGANSDYRSNHHHNSDGADGVPNSEETSEGFKRTRLLRGCVVRFTQRRLRVRIQGHGFTGTASRRGTAVLR